MSLPPEDLLGRVIEDCTAGKTEHLKENCPEMQATYHKLMQLAQWTTHPERSRETYTMLASAGTVLSAGVIAERVKTCDPKQPMKQLKETDNIKGILEACEKTAEASGVKVLSEELGASMAKEFAEYAQTVKVALEARGASLKPLPSASHT